MTEQHGQFRKTFEFRVPADRVWQAFTEPKELEAWLTGTVEEADIRPGGRVAWEENEYGQLVWDIVEVDPGQSLRYREGPGILPVSTEVTVRFEETESGARVTVTQSGFGAGDDWQGNLDNVGLGWDQTFATLELYLRTGVRFDRFFTFQSDLGIVVSESLAGPEVLSVAPESYGALADLRTGDIVVRLGAAPIFTRSDLWLFTREHPVGEEVEVSYVRDGGVHTARAALTAPM